MLVESQMKPRGLKWFTLSIPSEKCLVHRPNVPNLLNGTTWFPKAQSRYIGFVQDVNNGDINVGCVWRHEHSSHIKLSSACGKIVVKWTQAAMGFSPNRLLFIRSIQLEVRTDHCARADMTLKPLFHKVVKSLSEAPNTPSVIRLGLFLLSLKY